MVKETMNYEITYLAYSGRIVYTTVEDAESKDDAIEKAYDAECNYSSDCILKIISVNER